MSLHLDQPGNQACYFNFPTTHKIARPPRHPFTTLHPNYIPTTSQLHPNYIPTTSPPCTLPPPPPPPPDLGSESAITAKRDMRLTPLPSPRKSDAVWTRVRLFYCQCHQSVRTSSVFFCDGCMHARVVPWCWRGAWWTGRNFLKEPFHI